MVVALDVAYIPLYRAAVFFDFSSCLFESAVDVLLAADERVEHLPFLLVHEFP